MESFKNPRYMPPKAMANMMIWSVVSKSIVALSIAAVMAD